jgi:hypothetical protein
VIFVYIGGTLNKLGNTAQPIITYLSQKPEERYIEHRMCPSVFFVKVLENIFAPVLLRKHAETHLSLHTNCYSGVQQNWDIVYKFNKTYKNLCIDSRVM